MSVANTIPRSVALGTGLVNTYPWNWLVNLDPVTGNPELHVAVLDNASPQNLTVLTYGTDWTIQYPGVQIGAGSGGNVVLSSTGFLAASGGNLPAGWAIVVRRSVTFAQPSQLGNQAGFAPAAIESALDYLAMQTLQLQDAVAHCVQTPIDDYATPSQNVSVASLRANQLLGFDASGNPIAVQNVLTGVTATAFGNLLVQTANAAAAQTLLATTVGAGLMAAVSQAAAMGVLGGTTVGQAVFTAASQAAAQTALGAGAFGASLFAASTQAAAQVLLGQRMVGEIKIWSGTSAPTNFLICNGSVVSQATYAGLYAVIAGTFNTGGEGAGNFRLPNMVNTYPRGVAGGGDVPGVYQTATTDSQGSHNHDLGDGNGSTYTPIGGDKNLNHPLNPQGAHTHSTVRPANVGVNYIICYQ